MKPTPVDNDIARDQEPEFRAWRLRLLTRARILCIVALPVGILLQLPVVWILAILGIIVSSKNIHLASK